jgi:anti-sigma regulatory factor (Ser/Thr protein kinase)
VPEVQLRLPPDPRSVARAREGLRAALTEWKIEELEFAATQALTELATNAVLHARTDFQVTAEWDGLVLRVCVGDGSPRLPQQRNYPADSATGRGLALVDRLCRAWGAETTDAGKQVWFELTEADAARGDELGAAEIVTDEEDDAIAPSGDSSPQLRQPRAA